mmetsp:Transcript_4463/g.6107  ORF Transcript_4463/g.6107 Transcript_4463/m.6107 type:complete len:183 (-) Transcript_4463:190-738(-)
MMRKARIRKKKKAVMLSLQGQRIVLEIRTTTIYFLRSFQIRRTLNTLPSTSSAFSRKKRENFESFEQDLNKIARIYNEEPSPIKCYTKLEYGDKPYEAMKILLAVLDRCGADVVLELDEALAMKVSLTLEGKKKVQVQCLMHIYKPDKETDDRSIIEVRNLSYGDDDDFQNFFEALKKWLQQ